MSPIDRDEAVRIAGEWVEAFNAHRADLVVAHFADDVVAVSPAIALLRPDSNGRLVGRDAVHAFYEEGLRLVPGLHFDVIEVLTGVDQLTILYRNERQTLVAETLSYADGVVTHVSVTYGATPQ